MSTPLVARMAAAARQLDHVTHSSDNPDIQAFAGFLHVLTCGLLASVDDPALLPAFCRAYMGDVRAWLDQVELSGEVDMGPYWQAESEAER